MSFKSQRRSDRNEVDWKIYRQSSQAGKASPLYFRNLIENAISAMNGNGSILIQGAALPEWVEISITDSGPGIAPEFHNQIFELNFSRTAAHPGKLGFGLWWVKTLMTRLGGSVTVESDGDHGTTFRLRLPTAEALIMAQVLRALVVEDDHSWQQIISEILSECGLEVDIATNLDEAVLALKSKPHRVAVVDLSLSPNDHNNYRWLARAGCGSPTRSQLPRDSSYRICNGGAGGHCAYGLWRLHISSKGKFPPQPVPRYCLSDPGQPTAFSLRRFLLPLQRLCLPCKGTDRAA